MQPRIPGQPWCLVDEAPATRVCVTDAHRIAGTSWCLDDARPATPQCTVGRHDVLRPEQDAVAELAGLRARITTVAGAALAGNPSEWLSALGYLAGLAAPGADRSLPHTGRRQATVWATVGLPGSGKSQWATQWVTHDPSGRTRVSAEELRLMLLGRRGPLLRDPDDMVIAVQEAAIIAAVRAGRDVVVDDMHLRPDDLARVGRLAERAGAELLVQDFTAVPVEECVRNDGKRAMARQVGGHVIRKLHALYLATPSLVDADV